MSANDADRWACTLNVIQPQLDRQHSFGADVVSLEVWSMNQLERSNEETGHRISWTAANMPLLASIGDEFSHTRPFKGLRIGVSLHLEPKTAVLLEVLTRGGAHVIAAGNYGTTQADVVQYLVEKGIDARGSGTDTAASHLDVVASVVAERPDILLDNGADLVKLVLERGFDVLGGTEETTSGHMRLRDEFRDRLTFPMVVINDSPLKAITENKHAVGQSVYESFCRLTNLMPQGKRIVVVGYGWCGRGIAHYARANGAHVAVAEIDEIKTLEAALDGFRVGALVDVIEHADVVITATGAQNVVSADALASLPSGVLLANAGHFPNEIDIEALEQQTLEHIILGEAITRHVLAGGRMIDLVAGGRMLNLAGPYPKGNSIESMDLGFAMQARSLERVARHHGDLSPGPQPVPDDINRSLAVAFVDAMQSWASVRRGRLGSNT
jgi:adenosylhomocysteinase